MNKILVIQTAFIGDVILATPLVEALHQAFPKATIDFLLRKGNEGLLVGHPYLRRVIVWNKKEEKLKNQLRIIRELRKEHYDVAINLQRFLSTGIFMVLSGANVRIGFKKNPLSQFFTHQIEHATAMRSWAGCSYYTVWPTYSLRPLAKVRSSRTTRPAERGGIV